MKQENNKKKPESFDEEWLTRALRARSQAAPRPGLEERILARLASGHESKSQRRWRWMPALAVAFGVLLIVLVGREFLQKGPRARDQQATIVPPKMVRRSASVPEPPKVQATNIQNDAATNFSRIRTRSIARQRLAKTNTVPKLDKFPAETPATEQERLMAEIQRRQATAALAQYARDFHQVKDLIIESNSIPPLAPETADENPNR